MDLQWGPDFATGNETVDSQHRYFIALINRFRNAPEDEQQELIAGLQQYANHHFKTEISEAETLGLPGAAMHHQRHMELLDQLYHEVARFNSGYISANDLFQFMIQWFAGHTIHEDKKLFSGDLI